MCSCSKGKTTPFYISYTTLPVLRTDDSAQKRMPLYNIVTRCCPLEENFGGFWR